MKKKENIKNDKILKGLFYLKKKHFSTMKETITTKI